MNTMKSIGGLLALGVLGACVETQPPPEPIPQKALNYGPKIYLANQISTKAMREVCGAVGPTMGTTTSSGSSAGGFTVGGNNQDPRFPHNCYVKVKPGSLKVDIVETTNELFQLCVDSDFCKKPDPGAVEKAPTCQVEDQFDTCPVISVPQNEAARFCEFVGRRLPSAVEQIVMRSRGGTNATGPTNAQTVDQVKKFPNGNEEPNSCVQAVLKSCDKPAPINPYDTSNPAAAPRDDNGEGVYDLTGNVSEWVSDLMPEFRTVPGRAPLVPWLPAGDLPWFCERPLVVTSTAVPGQPGMCPDDNGDPNDTPPVCVYASFRAPGPAGEYREDWPLCYASAKLRISNGTKGMAFGGAWNVAPATAQNVGTFTYTEVANPNADSSGLGQFGVRCVGDPGKGTDTIVPE